MSTSDIAAVVRDALPDSVRENICRILGERGRAWVEALPGVVAGLARRWELELSSRSYTGGTHSLVLAVTRPGGVPALLKVPVLDEENRAEAAALRAYAGDGAALLYDVEPESGALLMERLEPGTPLIEHPNRQHAIDVCCGLLCRLRRPVPAEHPFFPVAELVRRWSTSFPAGQTRHGGPFPAWTLREVLATIEALGSPAGPEVLVNRDAHLGNVLAAEREPWLLIDPKPLVGEPAFDGGWLLIDVLRPAPTRDNARRLAARIGAGLGVDPDRVRAWALARAAEDVLWSLDGGDDPGEYLTMAAALLP
jgi:streptomycin 6-kinase